MINFTDKTPINVSNLNAMQKKEIITGQECVTDEWIDGKQVYIKRINFGTLPDNTAALINTGLIVNEVQAIIRIQGMAYRKTDGQYIPLPLVSPESIGNNIMMVLVPQDEIYELRIQTGGDRSNMKAIIDIYYTKN